MTGASDVQILREAAARMRALAEAATPGPWVYPSSLPGHCGLTTGTDVLVGRPVDAVYATAMQPAVAMAVAGLLDWAAAGSEYVTNTTGGTWSGANSALAVARAFLGTTP